MVLRELFAFTLPARLFAFGPCGAGGRRRLLHRAATAPTTTAAATAAVVAATTTTATSPSRSTSSPNRYHERTTTTQQCDAVVITTQSPLQAQPPLLLEGDEFYVSNDGIARSFYQLDPGTCGGAESSVAIEELYDLAHATKEFLLREAHDDGPPQLGKVEVLGRQAQGVVPMGKILASVSLQEIDEGVLGSAGTGATTWEASLAMALFFHAHPEQLWGDVVEIGCGVGLGGILNSFAAMNWHRSMTLTDGNEQVLEQCRRNVDKNSKICNLHLHPIQVLELDWNDYIGAADNPLQPKYDTVIACDCAYRYSDIEVLSRTLHGLSKEDAPSVVHMFAPYNRSALHEVIRFMKSVLDMDVHLDWIDLNRYRLKPGHRDHATSWTQVTVDECVFASKSQSKFLHVQACRKDGIQRRDASQAMNLWDID